VVVDGIEEPPIGPEQLLRHGDDDEARRQSQLLAELEAPNWSEQVPDWSDWTA
jgi:hypothetical protein